MSEFFNRFISGLIYKIVKSDEKSSRWSSFRCVCSGVESSIGTYFRETSMYARVPIGRAPFAVHLLPPPPSALARGYDVIFDIG